MLLKTAFKTMNQSDPITSSLSFITTLTSGYPSTILHLSYRKSFYFLHMGHRNGWPVQCPIAK